MNDLEEGNGGDDDSKSTYCNGEDEDFRNLNGMIDQKDD